jgi:uncharacterized membrane protein
MAVSEPINKVNLERLTNGIYAFTMTLMIRNIQTPQHGTIIGATSLAGYLNTTILAVFDFIGAFLILGMFWLFYFQIFHRMKTFDHKFLYIHLLSLMVVVFVPFTSSFSNESSTYPIADTLFQVNYFVLAILLVFAWHYARNHPDLLVPELTKPETSFLAKKFFVPLGVASVGIVFVIAGVTFFDVLYLLPFVILGLFFRTPPQEG